MSIVVVLSDADPVGGCTAGSNGISTGAMRFSGDWPTVTVVVSVGSVLLAVSDM